MGAAPDVLLYISSFFIYAVINKELHMVNLNDSEILAKVCYHLSESMYKHIKTLGLSKIISTEVTRSYRKNKKCKIKVSITFNEDQKLSKLIKECNHECFDLNGYTLNVAKIELSDVIQNGSSLYGIAVIDELDKLLTRLFNNVIGIKESSEPIKKVKALVSKLLSNKVNVKRLSLIDNKIYIDLGVDIKVKHVNTNLGFVVDWSDNMLEVYSRVIAVCSSFNELSRS